MSLPDSVGEFISDRYPALLADPNSQPEIYNSAASDYGVYASPELYGSVSTADYILYADINDYMFPAQPAGVSNEMPASPAASDDVTSVAVAPEIASVPDTPTDEYLNIPMYGGMRDTHVITVARGETLYSIARRYGATADEVAALNNLKAPYSIYVGQRLTVPGNGDIVVAPTEAAPVASAATMSRPAAAPTPARVQLQTVTAQAGDTLYSLSRKYSVPVNDLAVMNDLEAPFVLTVGQKLKVPNLAAAADAAAPKTAAGGASGVAKPAVTVAGGGAKPAATAGKVVEKNISAKSATNTTTAKTNNEPKTTTPAKQPQKKISSDPKQKLPKISARSSSKFSWPVRGKILSDFGTKPNGLVNDGINISAARGTPVGAAENGVVAYAGNEVKGMGNLVILQHADGWMTVYAHMDSMSVRRGARVNVGQKVGAVGSTGKVDRPQLHFEIRKGTKAYNPASYMKK